MPWRPQKGSGVAPLPPHETMPTGNGEEGLKTGERQSTSTRKRNEEWQRRGGDEETARAEGWQITAPQWGGSDQTREAARHIADSASKIHGLHNGTKGIPEHQASHADPMLLAFAMERALKAWHLRTMGQAAKRTHRWLELYEALPEEVRQYLDETAERALRRYPPKRISERSRLADVLETRDTAFQDWRYPEEILANPERGGLYFETGEVEAALGATLKGFEQSAGNSVQTVRMGTLGNRSRSNATGVKK